MNKDNFDINKIIESANKLGIKMKVDSENQGFRLVSPDGHVDTVSYEELREFIDKVFVLGE